MDPCHHSIHRHCHPSFSSTLLDQIYRSIDDSSTNSNVSMTNKKHHHNRAPYLDDHHRPIANNFLKSKTSKTPEPMFLKHSNSTSSDSSGFSSSEYDSFYIRSRSSRSPREISIPHPKPIRTTVSPQAYRPKEHGSLLRTKSKALKIYTDLKKVKQPISPGGKLATFLNSIFTGNAKKPTKVNTPAAAASTPASSTTCSSASSFSRSCLSKTSSSSEKSKRSVRFCPVNVVILDQDSKREPTRQGLDTRVMEENRRVIEAAKELLRTYQKNKDGVNISGEEEEDEDDDVASCASSDLFELENLSAIGIEKYQEELPVYETTRLNKNRLVSR